MFFTFETYPLVRQSKRAGIVLALLLLVSLPVDGATQESKRPRKAPMVTNVTSRKAVKNNQPETWGGEHIRIRFVEGETRVEFDCAHGTIIDPLKTNAEGRFDLNGRYVREGPGPTRLNAPRVSQAARYSGTINGDEMSLTVILKNDSQEIGTFTLKRGSEGLVRKCR